MITGGHTSSGGTASVLKFDLSNLKNNDPVEVKSMVNARFYHACTTFKSGLHDGRTIMVVAGDYGSGDKSAEIWDFTQEGTSWQKSNLIFTFISYVFGFFLKSARCSYSY